jgi:hypothetical protein
VDEESRPTSIGGTPQVLVERYGAVPDDVSGRAAIRVTSLLRIARGHVSAVRIVLTRTANPAVDKPATARATIVVDGRVVLVQVADVTTEAAVDHMVFRLRIRLEQLARYWKADRKR